MRQLMISLDKKILDPNSAVARRMVEYGQTDELFILIPFPEERRLNLSPTVQVFATGGNKCAQLWRLYKRGIEITKTFFISTQDPFFTGLVGLLIKKKTGVLLEVQLHGDFFSSDYYRDSGLKNYLQYHLGKYVVKRADRLRVVGERIRESLLRLGVRADKIIVRPIAVDAKLIAAHRPAVDLRRKYPAFRKIFLALGRFEPVKNLPWLISLWAEVLKKYPNYGLLIIGAGREEKHLRDLISRLGVSQNVILEPWTSDPWSYLKTADVLLFPSVSEGYGLVVMEALAAGASVIMNDVGSAHYEVQPGEKVVIVPIGDQPRWLEAIK